MRKGEAEGKTSTLIIDDINKEMTPDGEKTAHAALSSCQMPSIFQRLNGSLITASSLSGLRCLAHHTPISAEVPERGSGTAAETHKRRRRGERVTATANDSREISAS